ncbi:MAG: dihydroorotate dehydrogenase electron transfer subunit, partial [Armatimonadetes bacterium]|nr:dihydroorotate dehydrogenase electron transfer subunit [Armatimonadota bacterium]
MTAWQGEVTVEAVAPVAPGYFTLRFDQPLIAAAAAPGLFVNVQVPAPELCLRRPISFYAVEGSQVSLMVGVHGRGTAALAAARPGDRLDVMGPLGGRALSIAPEAQRVA